MHGFVLQQCNTASELCCNTVHLCETRSTPLLSNNDGEPLVFEKWEKFFISETMNTHGATALTTPPDETFICTSTIDGLYCSSNEDSNVLELTMRFNSVMKTSKTHKTKKEKCDLLLYVHIIIIITLIIIYCYII